VARQCKPDTEYQQRVVAVATDIRYKFAVQCEWDEAKAAVNLAKHEVSFTAAARALEDPREIEILGDRFDYDEERVQSLCMDRVIILFVVTVMVDENIYRIISARKATRHEQEQYFQGGSLFS
jgi:uncharacterized DUF497 family protein